MEPGTAPRIVDRLPRTAFPENDPKRTRDSRGPPFTRNLPKHRLSGACDPLIRNCVQPPCTKSFSPKTTTTCAVSWSKRWKTPAFRSRPTTTASPPISGCAKSRLKCCSPTSSCPAMDGIEVARRAAERDPDLRIMFITGFAAVALTSDSRRPPAPRCCPSPSTCAELVTEVKKMMAAHNSSASRACPCAGVPIYGGSRCVGGRVAQRESTSLTSRGSQVQSLSRPPSLPSFPHPLAIQICFGFQRVGPAQRGCPHRCEPVAICA